MALIRVVIHKVWDYRCHICLQLTFENLYYNNCIVYIYVYKSKITLSIGFVLLSTHHMFTTFIKLFQIWFQERFHKGLTKLFHFLDLILVMPLRWVVSIVHVSYDQEFFHPSKAQGEPKVVTPKFQNTLNFSTYQQTKMFTSKPKSTNLMLSSQEDNSDSSRFRCWNG